NRRVPLALDAAGVRVATGHTLLGLRTTIPWSQVKRLRVTAAGMLLIEMRDSARWAEHCRSRCAALEIPFELYSVTVDRVAGSSTEAAARDARYDVFRKLLEPDEMLLTAQHQDDQLETFLLQALRGAGPHGLAAMPKVTRLGQGYLLRPLLEWSRAALEAWAGEQQLSWLDDPSNDDEHFDRNFLRRSVLPAITRRWPSAARTVSRSARHCAQAAELVDELAAADLAECGAGEQVLDIAALRRLDIARRRNVLRHWLDWLGFPRPSEKKLENILLDVLESGPDAEPCVRCADVAVRRYRNGLYADRDLPTPAGGQWKGDIFEPGPGWGRLRRVPNEDEPGLPVDGAVEVRFREGGERLRLAGREYHHELKKLFQEAGVLPWRRAMIPLVYVDRQLAAVGDLWINADIAVSDGWRVEWQEKPRIVAD
ncbi:MAG: tRNA lysidine(34) synthetase TilS, partial [Proteobacteria bacterium]|nr:tRNA lysidine(34) synthetase TilS [Pseudomonadota bacterium]